MSKLKLPRRIFPSTFEVVRPLDLLREAVLGLLFLLLLVGCGSREREELIQLTGALDVRSMRVSGMDVLEYKLNAKYPADELIAEVDRKLKEKGWEPLPYIFLYPKYPSSHQDGWAIYKDPPKTPSKMIYEWSGDWKDSTGNIVTYTFRYEDPYSKYEKGIFYMSPGNSNLKVTAIYMSNDVAASRQRQMNPET